MKPISQPRTPAIPPSERPQHHSPDALSPTYPNAATHVLRTHPSSKHTLAGAPPGHLPTLARPSGGRP